MAETQTQFLGLRKPDGTERLETFTDSPFPTESVVEHNLETIDTAVGGGFGSAVSVRNSQDNNIDNANSVIFSAPSPSCEVTYVAPAGLGYTKIYIFINCDADAIGDEIDVDVEIRSGGPGGSVVHFPTGNLGIRYHWWNPQTALQTLCGVRFHNGVAGNTYWAQMQVLTSGTNIDIEHRKLVTVPVIA